MTFTITEARNPQWVDSNHNKIDLEVNFAELEEEWLPYTAAPDDICEHSRTLYSKAVAGDYGEVSTEYTITEEDLWTPVTDTITTVSKESLVQILLQAVKFLGASSVRRLPGAQEHIRFPLPKSLAK